MNQHIEIWNILHDGEISVIETDDKTNVTIFVHIPYLRRRIKPVGDSFILKLSGVSQIEFESSDGERESIADVVQIGSLEILSTNSTSMPIAIKTTFGVLKIDYKEIFYYLDVGGKIEYETIFTTCQEYWSEWEAKHKSLQENAK